MTQGDLRLYDPGEAIPVLLRADGNGDVADRGDPVELVGEGGGSTYGELLANDGEGVGALKRRPEEYDPDAAYGANEEIGQALVLADGPVDWYDEGTNWSGSGPGTKVVLESDGVREYDSAGGDTPDMIHGVVFATGTRASAATANKVAVLRTA